MVYEALDGLAVLNLGGGVASLYCAKLLADHGAEVVLLEPPEGDPTRRLDPIARGVDGPEASAGFAYLAGGQRSVCVDLDTAEGANRAQQLADDADVVIESRVPDELAAAGLDPATRRARTPAQVYTSISPFGRHGPYADWTSSEIAIQAAGGWMYGIGHPDREPLKAPGVQGQMLGALCGAMATLASVFAVRRTGVGDHLDVSCQEAVTWFLMNPTTVHQYSGRVWKRAGGRSTTNHPQGVMPCADGLIGVNVMYYVEWDRLCKLLDRPEWQADPRLATPIDRLRNAEVIDEVLLPWLAGHSVEEVLRIAGEHRLPFSRVATVDDLLDWDHLAVRDYWQWQDHPVLGSFAEPGAPFRLAQVEERPRRRAPLHCEHTVEVLGRDPDCDKEEDWDRAVAGTAGSTAPLPLEEIVIVDLSMAWAGPLAVRVLAELGADVIKIEGPTHLDRWRGGTSAQRGPQRYPDNEPGERPWNRNAFFNTQNRHKRSLGLDLKDDRGKEIFRRLVAQADLVVENFSAGAMGRLGLDYEVLRTITPDLIMVSLPAFGRTGPASGQLAHGPTIEAAAGNLFLQGYDGEEGLPSGQLAWGDPIAGMNGAVAALVALEHRARTGRGTHVDLSHVESAIPLNFAAFLDRTVNGVLRGPQGNRDPQCAPQGCYPCRGEDRWLVVSCPDDDVWSRLCRAIGAEDLDRCELATVGARREISAEIDARIATWSRSRDRDEAVRTLQAAGIPAAPVNDAADLDRDPQLQARGFFQAITHPEAGSHRYPGMPWRADLRPWMTPVPAPCFGEHNEEILRERLGLSGAEIRALADDGVIADRPDSQGD